MIAISICTRALRLLRLYGVGETPSADDLDLAFKSLNYLLDSMSASRSFVPVQQLRSFPTTGAQSYTIGPTGDIAAPRPTMLGVNNTVQLGENEFTLKVLTQEDYQNIGYKASAGMPECIALSLTAPNATLYVWPVSSGYTINLRTIEPLTQFADINTNVDLLPGYAEYLMYELAKILAPEFNVQADNAVIYRASVLKSAINKQVLQVPMLSPGIGEAEWRGRELFS